MIAAFDDTFLRKARVRSQPQASMESAPRNWPRPWLMDAESFRVRNLGQIFLIVGGLHRP